MFPGLIGLMKLTKTLNLPHSKDKHVQKWTFWKCLIMLAQSQLCEIRLWGHFNASKHNNWRINRLKRLSSGAESKASRRFQTHAETKRLSSACRDCGLFLWEQWRKQNAYTYRHTQSGLDEDNTSLNTLEMSIRHRWDSGGSSRLMGHRWTTWR